MNLVPAPMGFDLHRRQIANKGGIQIKLMLATRHRWCGRD